MLTRDVDTASWDRDPAHRSNYTQTWDNSVLTLPTPMLMAVLSMIGMSSGCRIATLKPTPALSPSP